MADNTSHTDKGKQSANTSNPDDANNQGENNTDNPELDGKSKKTDDASSDDDRKFSQKDIGRLLSAARKEERDRSEREAREKDQRAKGEHEKLNATLTAERDDLRKQHDDLQTTHDELSEAVVALINAEIKGLPDAIRELKPETEDPLLIMAWLKKAKKSAVAMAKAGEGEAETAIGTRKPGVTGAAGNPAPAPKKADAKRAEQEAVETDLRGRFNYQI